MTKDNKVGKVIYAVRSVSLNKVKIGESNAHSLFYRIRSHQTGSADELELVGVHFGTFDTDKDIHPLLKSSHSHLEWFNETEEVNDFLQAHFLILLKPLSLLTDISWSMGETISPETIAIGEYVKGNLKNSDYTDWSEKFDMLQYIKNAIANSRN
jgi:hypothetical protein